MRHIGPVIAVLVLVGLFFWALFVLIATEDLLRGM